MVPATPNRRGVREMAARLKRAEFTIRPNTWVTIVLVGFLAWAIIITGVVLFTVKAASIEVDPPKQCRGEFGHKRPPEFCE